MCTRCLRVLGPGSSPSYVRQSIRFWRQVLLGKGKEGGRSGEEEEGTSILRTSPARRRERTVDSGYKQKCIAGFFFGSGFLSREREVTFANVAENLSLHVLSGKRGETWRSRCCYASPAGESAVASVTGVSFRRKRDPGDRDYYYRGFGKFSCR